MNSYLVREGIDGNAECSGKTKISNFQFTFLVNQQVLRFEITVENTIFVTERCSFQQLIHEAPNGHRVQSTALSMGVHVFLEISIAIFEDKNELCFGVDDVVKADDVNVFELLHQGNLPDSS
jgi:hypothetical protein